MEFRKGGSSSEPPWLPATPAKGVIHRQQQIYGETHRSEACVRNWIDGSCCGSTDSRELIGDFNNWESAPAPAPAQAPATENQFQASGLGSVENWKNIALSDLLVLADTASMHSFQENAYLASQHSHSGARASEEPFNRVPQSTTWVNGNYGFRVPYLPTYDLNSPPGVDPDSELCIFSSPQFELKTPNPAERVAEKQMHETPNRIINEGTNQEIIDLENVVENARVEISDATNMDSSFAATLFAGDHNPDKGGDSGIDLNKTPKQKARRKKHRPRVITEGKPRKPRTPATPKLDTEGTPKPKRKYVRRKGVNKPSEEEEAAKSNEPETAAATKKSCRRSLNFDSKDQHKDEATDSASGANLVSESQAQNIGEGVQRNSMVGIDQEIEARVENSGVGFAHDITCYVSQVLKNYISLPEKQTSSTPPRKENGAQAARRIRSDSNKEKRSRGMKRASSQPMELGVSNFVNTIGSRYNSMEAYKAILGGDQILHDRVPGMHFPEIYKKRRSEKAQSSTSNTPPSEINAENSQKSSHSTTFASKAKSCLLSAQEAMEGTAQERLQALEMMVALGQKEKLTRKRSKGPTRARDLASLFGIAEHKMLALPYKQGIDVLPSPHTCMDALAEDNGTKMATKKRTRKKNPQGNPSSPTTNEARLNQNITIYKRKRSLSKSIGRHQAHRWGNMVSIEAITERLKRMDINWEGRVEYQEQNALVPYNMENQEQNMLVIYGRDGTVVPFVPIKKRRPRPKVDLDEETTRVWKLLLGNINSKGIDGTDEQKAKWWEEERRVFRGRADSFIARMHLVQGDRRFSRWKGSVVDSVVGVFLTQNVSDHLSSSAFMSLASRFPIKPKSSHEGYEECRPVVVEEPEIELCILDAEESGKCQDKILDRGSNRSSVTRHETEYNEEKEVVSCNESSGASLGGVSSSQNSLISSQNFVDAPVAQTAERIGSCSESTSDTEDLITRCSQKSFNGSTSFVELLKLAETTMMREVYSNESNILSSSKNSKENNIVDGSSNYHLQVTTDSGVLEVESIRNSGEESRFSDICKKSEDCMSEQSELTGESAAQAAIQKEPLMDVEEAPKSSNLLQGGQSETWKLSNLQNFSGEIVDGTESRNAFDSQKNDVGKGIELHMKEQANSSGSAVNERNIENVKAKGVKVGKEKINEVEWDFLRKEAQPGGKKREKTRDTLDSVDWETIRCADVNEIAHAIRERGMNNMLAERIQAFLNRLVRDHGEIDLEWLRDVPPDKAKEYLLSVRGLGLKSVECVRLLTLHHLAFPVDTNVGRIAVRLGWVPLQPLPESLQLHLLELYPVLESIQKYLWPRLCKLDQRTLYELHYQMITFGKVFCTKSKPNCNACPMRGECRHFASAFASARLSLPGPEEKSIVCATEQTSPNVTINPSPVPRLQGTQQSEEHSRITNCEPITEVPATPRVTNCEPITEAPETPRVNSCEPIIEIPASPEPECTQIMEADIEDFFNEDPDEIPTIKLNFEEFTQNLQNYMEANMELKEGEVSKALVALTPEVASIPMPKLKNVSRLRTEHQVYELPDTHPLLEGLDRREPDDPCSYLLAIWTPGETASSIQPPERRCSIQESGKLCDDMTCFACNSTRESNTQTVRGTLLIPCRTAMRGSFPLNGTYFQVNEVFADHDSSIQPIDVPRSWIWNLPRRTVYFGTSIPTIFKGMSTPDIQQCFWKGFVCVRGFDQKTRAPRPLMARLHFPASKLVKEKGKANEV